MTERVYNLIVSASPCERAAMALLPLLIEGTNLIYPPNALEAAATEALNKALDALIAAADELSYALLRKSVWKGQEPARDVMIRIDAVTAELRAIEAGTDLLCGAPA